MLLGQDSLASSATGSCAAEHAHCTAMQTLHSKSNVHARDFILLRVCRAFLNTWHMRHVTNCIQLSKHSVKPSSCHHSCLQCYMQLHSRISCLTDSDLA